MDRNSNIYTFVFAIIMVIVVAAALAFTATTLKPLQAENVRQEKMQNILSTIGINITRKEASEQFSQYVKQELALNSDGTVNEQVDAFKIELMKETKKSSEEQAFPLYIAEKEGKTFMLFRFLELDFGKRSGVISHWMKTRTRLWVLHLTMPVKLLVWAQRSTNLGMKINISERPFWMMTIILCQL